jgi:hypothetical protein
VRALLPNNLIHAIPSTQKPHLTTTFILRLTDYDRLEPKIIQEEKLYLFGRAKDSNTTFTEDEPTAVVQYLQSGLLRKLIL